MKALRYILFLVMPCVTLTVVSQKPNLRFEHLTTANGLSHSHVRCILQDSRGFMWFGTDNGLNNYDGYKFVVYQHDKNNKHSISNSYITGIAEDADGNLWIGTLGGGLNKFDRSKNRFTSYLHDPQRITVY